MAAVFGAGESGGALTVVNALVSGMGAALGVKLRVRVEVSDTGGPGYTTIRPRSVSGGLLDTVYHEFAERLGVKATELYVRVTSELPSGVGMKSSSSVANALILALADAYGVQVDAMDVLCINASASIRAGVSYTGALDDAAACLLGGVRVTDNHRRLILASYGAAPEAAVFLIPSGISRPDVKKLLRPQMRCSVATAHRLALTGRYHEALNLNGMVYAYAYGYPTEPIVEAWRLGVSAAGISGNGPAYAALASEEALGPLKDTWCHYGKVIITQTRDLVDGLGRSV